MNGLTDITSCTDRVLDIFLRTKGGEDGIVTDHLTVTERRQLADLMKWAPSAFLSAWIADAPADSDGDDDDFEGAILDRQDRDGGDYL